MWSLARATDPRSQGRCRRHALGRPAAQKKSPQWPGQLRACSLPHVGMPGHREDAPQLLHAAPQNRTGGFSSSASSRPHEQSLAALCRLGACLQDPVPEARPPRFSKRCRACLNRERWLNDARPPIKAAPPDGGDPARIATGPRASEYADAMQKKTPHRCGVLLYFGSVDRQARIRNPCRPCRPCRRRRPWPARPSSAHPPPSLRW